MRKRLQLLILFLIIQTIPALAQHTIQGRVSDNMGEFVVGAGVVNTNSGAYSITDADGFYSLKASEGDVLEISFVGLKSLLVTVGSESQLDIVMQIDEETLEEAFVVAYGTSRKSSFTGSAEVVSADDMSERPVTHVTKSIDGKVAGVLSTSGSGQPGSGAGIMIRGYGSINASSSPLLVVDGMPFDGDLNSISPSDIESLTILKDASAGALYGARGANGVVMITTKSAKAQEKVRVDFSAKMSVMSRAIPKYNTVNAREYMELMYNAVYNDLAYTEGYLPQEAASRTPSRLASEILGTNSVYNPYDLPVDKLFTPEGKVVDGAGLKYDEDWMSSVTAPAPLRQEYQVSFSGKTPTSRYLASIGYLDEDGLLKTTGFERYNGRLNLESDICSWLTAGLNMSYSHTNTHFLGSEASTGTNVWYSAQLMAPIYPVYKLDASGAPILDASGNKIFDYGDSRPAGAQNNRNSVATLYDDNYYTYSDNFSGRGFLKARWGDFSLTTNLGLDNRHENQTTNYNRYNGNAEGMGRLTKEYQRTNSYTWNQLLSWDHKWGEHHIDAMAGHEFYGMKLFYLNGERTGFPFGGYDELGMGSTISEAYSTSEEYYIDSWLSRLNYDLDDKYYLSASFRLDGSSRFEKSHRWGAFWSIGASWRISKEEFMKDISWIDNLTLKASYGVQGNDNIGTYYAWQGLYNMNYANSGFSGAMVSSLENPDISWEKNGNMNAGIEFTLLQYLTGTVEVFNRKTTDLLLLYPKAPSQGIQGYYANVGSMVNRGVDLTLGWDIIHRGDLVWNVGIIASVLNNKILALTSGDEPIVNGSYINKKGYPINSFYMSRSAGVDPLTGNQLYWAYEKDDAGGMVPGSEYITADQQVAANCKYILGSRIPDVYGSFSTSLKWKGLSFDMMLGYSLGGKIYDSVYQNMMEPSFVGQVYHRNVLRSWKQQGDISDVPKVTTILVTATTDRFLVDASYLSVKNITVGYDFSSIMKDTILNRSKAYISLDNMWTFTHLDGMNPQQSFSGSTGYSYVPVRSITLGVELSL